MNSEIVNEIEDIIMQDKTLEKMRLQGAVMEEFERLFAKELGGNP